jgi:Flp pilus assembly protein TadB
VHDLDMTAPEAPQPDRRKVRIGLAIISVVVVVAVVLFAVVDDPIGRAVMFAIAALGLVRAYLLSRSLRQS